MIVIWLCRWPLSWFSQKYRISCDTKSPNDSIILILNKGSLDHPGGSIHRFSIFVNRKLIGLETRLIKDTIIETGDFSSIDFLRIPLSFWFCIQFSVGNFGNFGKNCSSYLVKLPCKIWLWYPLSHVSIRPTLFPAYLWTESALNKKAKIKL